MGTRDETAAPRQSLLNWFDEERFSKKRMTELENLVYEKEKTTPLPSKSQFRAAIHALRKGAAPRRRS